MFAAVVCILLVTANHLDTAHAAYVASPHTAANYAVTGDSVAAGGLTLDVPTMLGNAGAGTTATFQATSLTFEGTLTIACPAAGGWATTKLLVTIINGISMLATPTNTFVIIQGVLSFDSKITVQGGTYSHIKFMEFDTGFIVTDNSVVEVVGGGTYTPASLTGIVVSRVISGEGLTVSNGGVVRVSGITMMASNVMTTQFNWHALAIDDDDVNLSGGGKIDVSAITMTLKDSQPGLYQLHAISLYSLALNIGSEAGVYISDIVATTQNVICTSTSKTTMAVMFLQYSPAVVAGGGYVVIKNTNVLVDSVTLAGHLDVAVMLLDYSALTVANYGAVTVDKSTIKYQNMNGAKLMGAAIIQVVDAVQVKDNSIMSVSESNVTMIDMVGGTGWAWCNALHIESGAVTMTNNATILLTNHIQFVKSARIGGGYDKTGALYSRQAVSLTNNCAIIVSNIQFASSNIMDVDSWDWTALNFQSTLDLQDNSSITAEDVHLAGVSIDVAGGYSLFASVMLMDGDCVLTGGSAIKITQTSVSIENVLVGITSSRSSSFLIVTTINNDRKLTVTSSSVKIDHYNNSVINATCSRFMQLFGLYNQDVVNLGNGGSISISDGSLLLRHIYSKVFLYISLFSTSNRDTMSLSNSSSITIGSNTIITLLNTTAKDEFTYVSLLRTLLIMESKSSTTLLDTHVSVENITTLRKELLITSFHGFITSGLSLEDSSMYIQGVTYALRGAIDAATQLTQVRSASTSLGTTSLLSISDCGFSATRANITTTIWSSLYPSATSVSGASTIRISGNTVTMQDSLISESSLIAAAFYSVGGPITFTNQSSLNITNNSVASTNNELIGDASATTTSTAAASVVDVLYSTGSGTVFVIHPTSSLYMLGNRVLVADSSSASRRVEAGPVSKTAIMRLVSTLFRAESTFNGTVAIEGNVITGGTPTMIFSSMSVYGSMKVNDNQITTPGTMFAMTGSVLPTIDSCSNTANGDQCNNLDGVYICSSTAVALEGKLVDCVSATSGPGSSNFSRSGNSSQTSGVGYSEPGFVAVTGITGGFGVLGGSIDSAASLQVAAMFSYMSCSTVSTRSVFVERLLLPLHLSDTRAAKLIGSFVLLIAITMIYIVFSALVLFITHRTAPDDEKEAEDRVLRIKGLIVYPRLPFFILLLLLPGMAIESGSLVYGSLSGGRGWEVFLGVLGLIISLLSAAYCVAVGVVVGRAIRNAPRTKQEQRDKDDSSPLEGGGEAPEYVDEASCSADHAATPPMQALDDPSQHRSPILLSPRSNNAFSDQEGGDVVSTHNSHNIDSSATPDQCRVHNDGEEESTPALHDEAPSPKSDYDDATKEIHYDEPNSTDDGNTVLKADCSPAEEERTVRPTQQHFAAVIKEVATVNFANDAPFLLYTVAQRKLPPKVLVITMLPITYWTRVISRSMYAAATSYRPDYIIATCGHHVVFVVLMGIVGAVDGQNDSECRIVQGFLAALCFLHAIFVAFTRPYRIPIASPLHVAQSLLLGLLACSEMMGEPDVHTALTIVLLIASMVTSVLTALVVLMEFWLSRKMSTHTPIVDATADLSADDDDRSEDDPVDDKYPTPPNVVSNNNNNTPPSVADSEQQE